MNHRGFSVPVVLVTLAAITSLALAAGQAALGHRRRATGYLERVMTRHAALSGIEAGRGLLLSDRTPWDGPGDPWFEGIRFRFNETDVSVRVIDEQGALAVNHLVLPGGDPNRPLIDAMESLFPEKPDVGKKWAEFIAERHRAGAYGSITTGIFGAFLDHCPVLSTHSSEIGNRVTRFMTSFGSGRINLNTASPEVLRALGGSRLEHAVEKHLRSGPLESIFQLDDAADVLRGITAVADVRSAFFTIAVTATGTFVSCRADAVVWRREGELTVLRHREWWL